jgi:peptide/nickel transport system substrate-binding protein
LPIEEVAKLQKRPEKDFQFSMEPQGSTIFIHFNVAKPPFNDVRVRQAVAYGINKKEMMEGIYHGYGDVVNQPFPRRSLWYCDVPELGRGIQKAKALLKEAGYPGGLALKLATTNTYPQYLATAQIMQAQLQEIGMKIELDVNDWPTHVKKSVAGDFAFSIAGWAAIADPDILYPAAFIPNGAYAFLTGKAYHHLQLAELIEQASGTVDFNKRKEIITRAVKLIVEDAPWIFTVTGPAPLGVRSYVKGFEAHPNALFSYAGGGLQYVWLDK